MGIQSLLRSRSVLATWLAISTIAAATACLMPLMGTLGFEFCLLTALITSLGAGHIASLRPSRVRNKLAPFPGARFPVVKLFTHCLRETLLLLVPPLGLVLLNGLRVPPCNLSEGLLFYLLLPVPAVLFATAAGLFFGLLLPGKKSAGTAWFLLYLALITKAFHSFYSTPAVFSFGPLHGYFPGVLYDTLISIGSSLITYRVATLIHTALFLSIAALLYDPATLRFSLKRVELHFRTWVVPFVLLATSVAFHLAEPSLGQHITRTSLEKELSRKVERGRLDIFFSPRVSPKMASDLADDAEFSLYQVERFFEVNNSKQRIAVFIFDSTGHKGKLIGASKTNVAKPWRSELYVVIDNIPHEVLRHELAHVVAGEFGRGPFAIAGAANGWWPNPGLIEGLASAAQGPRGDLTLHQWASAMKQLKLLPPLSRLFGMGFLNTAASTAYTAAGSFCIWLRDKHGADALKQLYAGADWKEATGETAAKLEQQWIEYLDTVELSEADIFAAKHRFDRPSVIGTTCVHEVSRLRSEASRLSSEGCTEESIEVRKEAVVRSGGATESKLSLFYALTSAGRTEEAVQAANTLLKGTELGKKRKSSVREILADMHFANGDVSLAGEIYTDLIDRVSGDGEKRRLIVKEHLTKFASPSARSIVEALALKPGLEIASPPLLMLQISKTAAAAPDDPILSYLLARQFFLYGDDEAGLTEIDKAYRNNLSEAPKPIRQTAEMLRGQALFRLGRFDEARGVFDRLLLSPDSRLGTVASARDWMERCKFSKLRNGRSSH